MFAPNLQINYSIAPPVEIKNEAMHLAAVRNKNITVAGLQLIMVGLHPL